jgi:putative tricarboxylic transport membrane protein
MERMNKDSGVAIALLVLCGIFFAVSFDIRIPTYGVLLPSTWPRIILAALGFLSLIYLFQSLNASKEISDSEEALRGPGLFGWLNHWKNPIWCFVLFFVYLVTLPVLGMLIGGISFVFLLLNVLGGWSAKNLTYHGIIAVTSIGAMWALFTYGLGVLLPASDFPYILTMLGLSS